jgi:hypothetical protein
MSAPILDRAPEWDLQTTWTDGGGIDLTLLPDESWLTVGSHHRDHDTGQSVFVDVNDGLLGQVQLTVKEADALIHALQRAVKVVKQSR